MCVTWETLCVQNIQKCVQVQRQCAKYKSGHNPLAQYSRQNNVILSGIPDCFFFLYQIISTYYKRLQQTNWKWKYNVNYKHTTTTEPYAP